MEEKDEVQAAFDLYEHVFSRLNNSKTHESNKFSVSQSDRIEHDLTEREKELLELHRAKLTIEISKKIHATILESSQSNDRLGNKVFMLNFVVAALTAVMATTAILTLFLQK
jgi:hypothetical protein